MNILYLEASPNWGGQELSVCLEVNWANAHGHQAWLLCDPDSSVVAKGKALGTRIQTLKMRRRISPLQSLRLWRFCKRHQIAVVNANSSKDHWVALPLHFAGIPVTRSRSITDPIGGPRRAWIYAHGCSKILTVARIIKEQMVRLDQLAPDKIEVIGNGIDLSKFLPATSGAPFRRELGIDPEVPLIVNIGMIRPDKGQELLIDAAKIVLQRHPAVRFALVGSGTGNGRLETKLKQLISEAGLSDRILMLGYRWDTPLILAAANLVVVASQRTESSSLVAREAAAMGKALITTDVGDARDVFQHGTTAWIVAVGSAASLADGLLHLLDRPELASTIAQNSYALAQREFEYALSVQRRLAVYQSLVSPGSTKG